jgi:DNA-binding PadR family transcriptional regulator
LLTRIDWLLLFIGLPGGKFYTDQIRVMKGMFLLDKEGPQELRDLYDFQPYDYGPFDTRVYRDLDHLEALRLIEVSQIVGTNRQVYGLTAKGEERMKQVLNEAPQQVVEALHQIKELVTSRSFTSLLQYVYKKYPTYAARTVMR